LDEIILESMLVTLKNTSITLKEQWVRLGFSPLEFQPPASMVVVMDMASETSF
jgi:hypothetical protein